MTSAFVQLPDFQEVLAQNWLGWDDGSTAQLVTLADMIKTSIARIVQIDMAVEILMRDLSVEMRGGEPSRSLPLGASKKIVESMAKVIERSKEMNLPQTREKAEYLNDIYSHRPRIGSYSSALKDVEHLRFDFIKELTKTQFLRLNPGRAQLFVGDDPEAAPFGSEVFDAFPSAQLDIREASNTYALERWPACVFHLMRVLEFGLRTMAEKFSVPYENSCWHTVIEQIEAKVRKIDKSFGPNWKQQQKDYSDAATQFMFFKDAWRNHIMHIRDVYDQGRAASIWQHVQEFMKKLATIGLKETA